MCATLRLIQINLHHCKAASAALLLRLARDEEDVALIQELWVVEGQVRAPGHTLLYRKDGSRPRSCILVRNRLNGFLLSNFSGNDVTTAAIEARDGTYWLASIYMASEDPDPSSTCTRRLVEAAKRSKAGLVLGCDSNAHHTIWGSSDINVRDPTFITRNRSEVLDLTIVSEELGPRVCNWTIGALHNFLMLHKQGQTYNQENYDDFDDGTRGRNLSSVRADANAHVFQRMSMRSGSYIFHATGHVVFAFCGWRYNIRPLKTVRPTKKPCDTDQSSKPTLPKRQNNSARHPSEPTSFHSAGGRWHGFFTTSQEIAKFPPSRPVTSSENESKAVQLRHHLFFIMYREASFISSFYGESHYTFQRSSWTAI